MGRLTRNLHPAVLILVVAACGSPPEKPEPLKTAPTSAPKVFEFAFDNIQKAPEDEGPAKGTAWVTIVKRDALAGQVSVSFIHAEGDRIGWTLEEGRPTSIHRVFSKKLGRSVNVDFNCGATIKEIKIDSRVAYEFGECRVVRGQKGAKPCDGIEIRKDHYRANEVTYSDDQGDLQRVRIPMAQGPREDRLCALHGGNLPANRVETGDQRRQRLTREAVALLWEADELWKSKNPKVRFKAREIYCELLKDYSSESVVGKNHDRIKSRSEAEIED